MKTLLKAWNRFLFSKISPLPMGIYRAIFGTLVFTNLLGLFPSRLIWWGEHGILSREASVLYLGPHHLNLINLLPNSDSWFNCFYILIMASAIFLAIGLFSRISSILVF